MVSNNQSSDLPPLTAELARRAMALVSSWNVVKETFVGDESDSTSWLEVLVHELSHAVDAGLSSVPFTDELFSVVSSEISDDRSIEAERRALATEWWAWQALGLPWEWEVLADLGEIQGVDAEDLFLEMFDPSSKERLPALLDLIVEGLRSVEM